MEIRKDYCPWEIAAVLCRLADENFKDCDACGQENPLLTNVTDALYQLMAVCENKYNSDYYRDFWMVLQDISEKYYAYD